MRMLFCNIKGKKTLLVNICLLFLLFAINQDLILYLAAVKIKADFCSISDAIVDLFSFQKIQKILFIFHKKYYLFESIL